MVQQVIVKTSEDEEKPTLTLLEHEKKEFVNPVLQLLDEDDELENFLQEKKIEIIPTKIGLRIEAGPYIGSAEFSNFILTVNPKFTEIENIGRLIDYAYDIKDEDIRDFEILFHELKNQPMEIIILLFVKQCKKIVQRGLVKSYKIHQDDISFLKGRLLLQQQIKNQAKFNLKFSCEYDEFTSNIEENQILLYTLDRCYNLTQSNHRKKIIQRIVHQMDAEVELKLVSLDDFKKINYQRLNQHYKKPHILAKLILRHLGLFDFKKQSAAFVVPYFIPMFQVFEDFLTKLFDDYYDMTIDDQVDTTGWKINGKPKSIIPDIITYDSPYPKRGSEVSIIDAKYMLGTKFGENKEDYQIAFYLNDYKKKTGYAILPKSHDDSENIPQVWHAPNQDITIKVKYVAVDIILDLIYSKENKENELKKLLGDLVPLNPNEVYSITSND